MPPDDYFVTDETYLKGGGKDQPAKCGLNFMTLVSTRCTYIHNTLPYTGKSVDATENHIKDTLTLVKRKL